MQSLRTSAHSVVVVAHAGLVCIFGVFFDGELPDIRMQSLGSDAPVLMIIRRQILPQGAKVRVGKHTLPGFPGLGH